MANDNTVTIIGNATREPEVRHTNSGFTIASFGVAINQRKKNASTGEWEDGDPSYFDVTCFRELAENVAETITKGSRVIVAGTLRQSSWETPEGDKRSKVEIIADEVGPSLRWATATIEKVGKSGAPERRSAPRSVPALSEEAF